MIDQIPEAVAALMQQAGPPTEQRPRGAVFTTNGARGLVLIREGYSVEEMPGEQRGVPHHLFQDLLSFAAHLNRRLVAGQIDTDKIDVLITDGGAGVLLATADFDARNKLAELVKCEVPADPAFVAWNRTLGQWQGPGELQAFIRTVATTLDGLVSQTPPVTMGEYLLQQLEQLSVNEDSKVTVTRSRTGMVEAASQSGGGTTSAKIPDHFEAMVPIRSDVLDLEGGQARHSMEILVSMKVSGGELRIQLTCPRLPEVLRQSMRMAVGYLRSELDPALTVGVGKADSRKVECFAFHSPPPPPSSASMTFVIGPVPTKPAAEEEKPGQGEEPSEAPTSEAPAPPPPAPTPEA